jgi:alcohol dehydrogenase class IV
MEEAGWAAPSSPRSTRTPPSANLEAGLRPIAPAVRRGDRLSAAARGSILAKMVAFMAGQTRPVWDFEDIGDWWTRADPDAIHPIVAVPTTAGTGSEVGRASVITNSGDPREEDHLPPEDAARGGDLRPRADRGHAEGITAGTGLDAFAHCVEAYSSPHYHPMSQGIALEGMRLVKENLPRAYEDGTDIEARAT